MKVTPFWGGPLSNWYITKEPIQDYYSEEENPTKYNCVEQGMMHQKALMFGDTEIADQILKESNPRQQKALGRKISNFDPTRWMLECRDIVFRLCLYKFSYDEYCKNFILGTKGTILVEASPYDKVWGIGMKAENPNIQDPTKWNGLNFLGFILTDVRGLVQ